jgi:hypothetical protein
MTPTEVFLIALLFASAGLNGIFWLRWRDCRAAKLDGLADLLAGRSSGRSPPGDE